MTVKSIAYFFCAGDILLVVVKAFLLCKFFSFPRYKVFCALQSGKGINEGKLILLGSIMQFRVMALEIGGGLK